ncbi:MAG: methyltransferase domain-containing protein [Desulfurococcaceae archaeon]
MSLGYGSAIKRVLTTIGEPDPTRPTYLSQLFHRRRYRALATILRTLSKGHVRSLLDAGCGKGFLYKILTESGVNVNLYICLDIDSNKLINASGLLICADIHKMPLIPCSVEYSVVSEVLEHLEKPFVALRNVLIVTKKYLVVTFPNELIKNALGFRYPEHITSIDVNEVTRLAERYGFKKVLHHRLNYIIPPSTYDKFLPYNERTSRLLEAFQKIMNCIGCLNMIKTEIIVFKRLEECY